MIADTQEKSKSEKLISNLEFNRFGLIFVILTIVGCLGGIVVGMGAVKSSFLLTLVVIPTMTTLSLLLAVSPMKWIMASAVISVAIDIILMVYLNLN